MVDRCGYYTRDSNSENSNTNHPSFSSTLLDTIYRSIDQGEDEIVMYGETMSKKQTAMFPTDQEISNFQRACMIEKWMEKKAGDQKVAARRKSTVAEAVLRTSSWDSSGAGFLSSSDADSFYEKRPKPIRVCDSSLDKDKSASRHDNTSKDGFKKTKSRALKIYADLKKVKQPISPGARLAGFLNSLFTAAGNTKKPKMNNPESNSPILKSANASTCSSASSFSRSCLSKTPSSRGKSAGGEKRSVRFSPVSVIVDEDCQPRAHKEMNVNCKKKNLEAINEEIMVHVMEKNRRVEEAARDFLRNYQKKMDHEFRLDHFTKSHHLDQEFDDDEEDDDDDDAASYASSDLFELDNLSAIGMERYREELPVYETTRLHTNRAIASGLIL